MNVCKYPGCGKTVYAEFHGSPLCREHWDLSQWISLMIYTVETEIIKEVIEV